MEILQNKTAEVTLLQETHSTKEIESKWQKEWKGKSFWHSGKITKSFRVAILLKENLNITILQINTNEGGRILSLNFLFENRHFQLLNIYGPTKVSNKTRFYKNLKKYINAKTNLILGGDFNMVEDLHLDRKKSTPNNAHLLAYFRIFDTNKTN